MTTTPLPSPPAAERRPVVHEIHGDHRVDDYAWLRERDDPAVIAHLEAENVYTDAMTEHTAALRQRLYDEIVGRIQETDSSAAYPYGAFEYYIRTEEGRQYQILCRRPRGSGEGGAEQVILDHNALAEGHEYMRVGDTAFSPDQKLVAYSVDTDGSEKYTLRFRELDTGADLDDTVAGVYYSLAWASDNATIFYTRPDSAMRPYQVWRHRLGTPAAADTLVLQEDDERFFASVERTRSGALILIELRSVLTAEVHLLPADAPDAAPAVIEPRRQGHDYGSVADHGDSLFIVSNEDAVNFRLFEAPIATPGRAHWREVIPHRDDVKLDSIDAFAGRLVLHERAGGMRRISVRRIGDGDTHVIEQPESVYVAYPGVNLEWDTPVLRFGYSSLVTPPSDVDYEVATRTRTVVKQQPVLGGYDSSRYVTERLWATAPDGVRVPISAVRRRDTPLDGTAPALLYGYGSYEVSIDPSFSSMRLSLLDRGFVYAIAHIRGGGEMGRRWYEDGKFAHKMNTFTDFIACADHLVAQRWTSPDRLAIRGGSAGGLLMGAVLNLRPDLAAAAVAQVPFVDSINTMLDNSLPLTVTEHEEWGDPNQPDAYRTMRAYSPYENVHAADYPAVLATTGLNDPRVGYWEPAKWVARLRERRTGDRPVLLQIEMVAGHGGPSGRYDAWRKEAFVLGFVLDRLPGWHEPS